MFDVDAGSAIIVHAFLRQVHAILMESGGKAGLYDARHEEAVSYIFKQCFISDRERAEAIIDVATRDGVLAVCNRLEKILREKLGTNDLQNVLAAIHVRELAFG